jgi:LysM repeat protein
MKRISILIAILTLASTAQTFGDAATEERLNQLAGRIEDLMAGQETMRKRVAELGREIDSLREQQSKPGAPSASQEDLKRLADSVKEVDRKRQDDYEKTSAALLKIGRNLSSAAPVKQTKLSPPVNENASTEKAAPERPVFEYTIQSGDTLDAIVQAYKAKNIKITVAEIVKANPGLVPEKMHVGQKINIPAPTKAASE